MKSESDRMINELSILKDNEIKKVLQEFKTEINNKNNEIRLLKQLLKN